MHSRDQSKRKSTFKHPAQKEETTFTFEILQNLPDENLVAALTQPMLERFAHLPKDARPAQIKALPLAKQAICLVAILDQAMKRDGWEKFHTQYWLEFITMIPEALQMIGAPKHEMLVRKAVQILKEFAEFDYHLPHSDIDLYLKMQALDREYASLGQAENLDELKVQFIRRNLEAFAE